MTEDQMAAARRLAAAKEEMNAALVAAGDAGISVQALIMPVSVIGAGPVYRIALNAHLPLEVVGLNDPVLA